MSKLLWKSLLAGPAAIGAALAVSGAAVAAEATSVSNDVNVGALEQAASTQEPIQLAQITSVTELSDVTPVDWAYQALQNLVETYGCIQGYPDGTFRGQAPLTRFEFAAGLNACMNVLLNAAGGVSAEDLATLRRLQEEFQAELATLRGRVDALEADTAELRAQQFSTTTKLRGQVDMHLGIPFDTFNAGGFNEDSTTFVSRARLNFDSSFTGNDRLRVRLQASSGNLPLGAFGGYANASGTNGGQLNVAVDDFYYTFGIGNSLDITVAANGLQGDDWVTSTIVPFDGPSVADAGGPQFYDAGGSSSNGVGAGFSFALGDNFVIDAGYTAANGDAANPDVGIFSARGQSYIAQLSFLSDGFLNAAVTYEHSDLSEAVWGGTPGGVDTFAGLLNLDFGGFFVAGYGAYQDFQGTNASGQSSDFNWTAGVGFNDLFLEGSQLGVYGGQLPQTAGNNRNPWLVEGYYEIPFNEFLTITPAVIYGDANFTDGTDDSTFYGVVRATFKF